MDATLAAAVSSNVTGYASDAVGQLTTILPIALPVTIGVGLVFAGIGWFRSLAHV